MSQRFAAAALLSLIACALIASCARQVSNVKDAVIGAVQMTKATDFKFEKAIVCASPAYRSAAMSASADLGLSIRDLLTKSKFPLSLSNLVVAPTPNEITVRFHGRFAKVFIQPEYSSKVIALDMVRDRGGWYFYLYSPVEEKRYGKFPDFK